MSNAVIGIIIFVCMIAAVLIGAPVYIAILGAVSVGVLIVGGPSILIQQLSTGIVSVSASYNFAVIPLFITVGVLAGETALGEGIFTACQKWLGRIRGGLLYTVIVGNAIFGACSGISSAGSIVFAKVAAPEMKKIGYDESLSLGTIAAAGVLSCLIPPSVGIMTFCLITEQSIGTGLMTGFSAGILMVIIMLISAFAITRLMPGKVPSVTEADRNVTWKERIKSLRLLVPVLLLFALVIGGSFFGWFPATVGGAIASVAIMIYALAKKSGIKRVFMCVWESAQMFAGIFLVIVACTLFSRFVTMTGLAQAITNLIIASGLPAFVVMLIIIIFYGICGCIMDAMSIILMTVPIVFPMLTGLGYNGFVICVILVLCAELGAITPPLGLSVFTVSSALRIKPSTVFKGVWPYIIIYVVAILLIVIFPDIILWLPKVMGAAV